MMRDVLSPGERIGDYEILGRLKAGGMGTLFRARQHGAAGFTRQIVLKVIHGHLADDELIVKMFIDEARICSRVRHSNVVGIEKFGEHEGMYFMVMEYVDGCSLDQLIRSDVALPPVVVSYIVSEIAEGLHAAHETCDDDGVPLGIVHRDVSPANVLLTRDGRVKVIDFGIAKARGRLSATKSGAGLKGKISYMSPEQACGLEVDRRTDVFALGVVLWECLARTALFTGTDELAVLEQVRNPRIPPASSHNPAVPPALDAVISHATATELERRCASADVMRRELLAAVPEAAAVQPETLAVLVASVRDDAPKPRLGADAAARLAAVLADREDEPRIVRGEPLTPSQIHATTVPNRRASPTDTSSAVAGELRSTRLPRRRLIAGAALALVVGGVVGWFALGRRAGELATDDLPAVAPSTRLAPVPTPDAAFAAAPDAAPDAFDQIVTTPGVQTDAGSATKAELRPNERPKKRKPEVIRVDGTELAP